MATADVRSEPAAPEIRSSDATPHEPSPVSDLALWTSVLGPPFVFLLNLEITYAMVTWACAGDRAWALHLVHLLALAGAIATGLLGRALWTRVGPEWPGTQSGATARARFMAALGALGGGLFALVILAQWVTVAVQGPCLRN